MKRLARLFLCAAIIWGGSMAKSQEPSGIDVLDGSYVFRGVQWDAGAGGISFVAVKLREKAGRVELCGAFGLFNVPGMWQMEVELAMRNAELRYGRKLLLRGLWKLAGPIRGRPVGGETVNCVLTSTPWSPQYGNMEPLRLTGLRNLRTERDGDEAEEGGAMLTVEDCEPIELERIGVC